MVPWYSARVLISQRGTSSTLTLDNLTSVKMAMRRRNSFFRSLKNVEPDLDDCLMDRGATAAAENLWAFEVAWEVANKGSMLLFISLTDNTNHLELPAVLRHHVQQQQPMLYLPISTSLCFAGFD